MFHFTDILHYGINFIFFLNAFKSALADCVYQRSSWKHQADVSLAPPSQTLLIKCDAHINKHSGRSESPHVIISGWPVPCHHTLAVT